VNIQAIKIPPRLKKYRLPAFFNLIAFPVIHGSTINRQQQSRNDEIIDNFQRGNE